jgi:putrescine transport system ATP-binding protein
MGMYLRVDHISKSYGAEQVLDQCTLQLAQHRTLSILGRSSSGKTTLLKIMAGLEQPDAGEVLLEGRRMNAVPPHQRNIVYLYQEPLLFPHLDVFENLAFGLRLRQLPGPEVRERVEQLLMELELTDHARKAPGQLSGGQRQRVAFGRALIINPRVLLLDEPFGALDALTRTGMQQLFKRMAREYAITALFVTHDLKEALLMGDEIAVMDRGKLRTYSSKRAFIADPGTGVGEEIAFWEGLQND